MEDPDVAATRLAHRERGYRGLFYVFLALVLVVAIALVAEEVTKKRALNHTPKITADQVLRDLVQASKGIFTNYRIIGNLAVIDVDPTSWSLLSRLDRRRVGDGFAANIPLQPPGLNRLEYRVGDTVVGRVSLGFAGQTFELID